MLGEGKWPLTDNTPMIYSIKLGPGQLDAVVHLLETMVPPEDGVPLTTWSAKPSPRPTVGSRSFDKRPFKNGSDFRVQSDD